MAQPHEVKSKEEKVKELRAEIEKLESSRDGIIDWVAKQSEKLNEISKKAKAYNDEFIEKNNSLSDRSRDLGKREDLLKKLEESSVRLKQEAQFEQRKNESILKELFVTKSFIQDHEKELLLKEQKLAKKDQDIDKAMNVLKASFITMTNVFKEIGAI
jgi:chromosome segregation ATPase